MTLSAPAVQSQCSCCTISLTHFSNSHPLTFAAKTQCPRTALSHMLYLGAGGPEGSGVGLLLQLRTRRKLDKKHRGELAAR